MKKSTLYLLPIVLLLCSTQIKATTSLRNAPHQTDTIPIPSKAQITWQNAELTAVFHYDLHVFDGGKYIQAENRITPIKDINLFNPTELNTDQWIQTVKQMGAKIAIITATHETGFALYQSDVNPYCMKALRWKEGKGDIIQDFVNSCHKYGIKPGIYIGIRWNSFLGVHNFLMPQDGTVFQKNRQIFYNKMCEGMTEELMSRYGDLAIVWYDGGGYGPELGGANILPIVEKYQKDIIFYHNTQRADIRWGGSETGTVSYPCWGTYPFHNFNQDNLKAEFKNKREQLKTGDPNGNFYMPAMSDSPLRGYNGRHEWFWEPNDEEHIFPLLDLIHMYMNSVGNNSTLILGITPDSRGLIPAADSIRLKEFGDEIQRRFKFPLGSTSGTESILKLQLGKEEIINALILREKIQLGERVRNYHIEAKVQGKWTIINKGTCIGHKHIVEFTPIKTSELRLTIENAIGEPFIADFSVYSY